MKRASKASKSRNGCLRCKQKHIKCDETKPECRICQAQGAECPGYARPLKWSNKHEVFVPPSGKRRRVEEELAESVATFRRHDEVIEGRDDVQRASSSSSPPSVETLSTTQPSSLPLPGQALTTDADLDWPNLELYGYEYLAFSNPDFGAGLDTNYMYPFLGDLCGNTTALTDSAVDTSENDVPSGHENGHLDCRVARHDLGSTEKKSPGAANLLSTFYRLTVPNEVPGYVDNDLVKHYFDCICGLYSCFDSEQNPFRTLVSASWQESRTIYYTIQSMAVGHLANYYPHMASMGLVKRGQAWKSLQQDLQQLRAGKQTADNVLLSLLLLGLSSAWQQASNLGLQYLFITRDIVQGKLQRGEESDNDDFYLDAIMHWELLASFVDPVPMMPLSGLKCPTLNLPIETGPRTPHPWTGISNSVHFLLGEVGRVLRRRNKDGSVNTIDDQWTSILEDKLHNLKIASEDDIVDFQDPKTTKDDLIRIARAYRILGFLELYRVKPQLLLERLKSKTLHDDVRGVYHASTAGYAHEVDAKLSCMANCVLETIRPVFITSSACRSLPLALLISASQLRLPNVECCNETTINEDVINGRYVVEQRMLILSRRYPQRPLMQTVDVIKEVWERADAGAQGAHWMDVSHEKGWQTILG